MLVTLRDEFVAVDFETANDYRGSACEIGLAKFVNGSLVEKLESLILPHELCRFVAPRNFGIHGISEAELDSAPEISAIWESIWRFVGNAPLVAHNAAFDMGVLFDVSGLYSLKIPRTNTYCSLVLARAQLGWPSHTLDVLTEAFGIERERSHRALDDALAAGRLLLKLGELANVESLDSLAATYEIRSGILETNLNVGCKRQTLLSDHTTSLPRSPIPAQSTNTEQPLVEPIGPMSREALLVWINSLPPGVANHSGVFHGEEFFFPFELKRCSIRTAQKLVAIEGGLASSRFTKFTSLVVIPDSDVQFSDQTLELSDGFGRLIRLSRSVPIIFESEFLSQVTAEPEMVEQYPYFPPARDVGVYFIRL